MLLDRMIMAGTQYQANAAVDKLTAGAKVLK